MKAILHPIKMGGKVNSIPSKSYAHRMLLCAMLSNEEVELFGVTGSKDMEATINCIHALAGEVITKPNKYVIKPVKKERKDIVLDCIESGSTLRFILPIALALGKSCKVIGKEGLQKRPLKELVDVLREHGGIIDSDSLPLNISGQLQSGDYKINGSISSQYITGLLMALPILDGDSTITITGEIVSSKYIEITLDVLKYFGIQIEKVDNTSFYIPGNQKYLGKTDLRVQGDWSNAAFWLALGALNGETQVNNLYFDSVQGDREILQIVMDMGAKVAIKGDNVIVSPRKLHSITVDAKDIPDLMPIVSVLMAQADGISVIKNVDRLKTKETDRLKAIMENLSHMGIQSRYQDNELLILGGKIKAFHVGSYNDHRMVMMAAVAASIADGECSIDNIEAVDKSYPNFFDDYKQLGGKVNVK